MIDISRATNEKLVAAQADKQFAAQYFKIRDELQRRLDEHMKAEAARVAALPFNPKKDVSADARHVVKHLWIIFVLLPVVLAILYSLLK
jgi:hypothetical protein